MKFTRTDTDEHFSIARWESHEGRWEAGLVPMLFGVRVRVGKVGACFVVIDYCAGADVRFQLELLITVFRILFAIDEQITEDQLAAMMPRYQKRPINLDPCWEELLEMAEAFDPGVMAASQF